jgi:DNA modification methylase
MEGLDGLNDELEKSLQELEKECKIDEDPAGDADAEPQIDKAAELQKKWQTAQGQLWLIGDHRLLCGDSTKREDVERVMGGERACCVFTDPPYGQNQEGVPNDEPEKLVGIISGAVCELPCDNSAAVFFQSPRTFPTSLDAMRTAGWKFERMLWLYKSAQCSYPWQGWILTSESILVFSKGNPQWNEVNPYSHDTYQLSEVSGELPDSVGWHGSVKPLVVVQDILSRICYESSVVYEPFSGSGTTFVAAQNLHRKCYGIEISPAYCAVILERMKTAFPTLEIRLAE